MLLSLFRDKDGPVVFVGDDEYQSIEVRATVANRGNDPSYATSMYTSYPAELLDLDTQSNAQVLYTSNISLLSKLTRTINTPVGFFASLLS